MIRDVTVPCRFEAVAEAACVVVRFGAQLVTRCRAKLSDGDGERAAACRLAQAQVVGAVTRRFLTKKRSRCWARRPSLGRGSVVNVDCSDRAAFGAVSHERGGGRAALARVAADESGEDACCSPGRDRPPVGWCYIDHRGCSGDDTAKDGCPSPARHATSLLRVVCVGKPHGEQLGCKRAGRCGAGVPCPDGRAFADVGENQASEVLAKARQTISAARHHAPV
jgi:hypothetical protein